MKTKTRVPTQQYLDEVYVLKKGIDVPEQFWDNLEEYTETLDWVDFVKAKWGLGIPLLFQLGDDPKTADFYTYAPAKQGVPMDWWFYSKQIEITPEDISAETNAEKRRLLMTEYGIAKYLTDIKPLHEDNFGFLFDCIIEGEPQRWVRVLNATPETEEAAKYYAERDMLGPNNCRYYFIMVPSQPITLPKVLNAKTGQLQPYTYTFETAKDAVMWTCKIATDSVEQDDWDFEA